MQSNRILAGLPVPIYASPMSLPMLDLASQAGFRPSSAPCNTHMDLAEALIQHPQRTFMQRAVGDSMEGAGIFDGDLLLVDRQLAPQHGDIVVAQVNGEFTCKRYGCHDGVPSLQSENPDTSSTPIQGEIDIQIWGVVTNSVRRFRTV